MLGNMDFSKLNGNEKLAVYGAGASIVGAILAQVGSIYGAGGLWLSFLLALAMIAIVFLPQWSPQTSLPGSKGSLMLIVGAIAAVGALLGLLAILGAFALFALYGGLWFIGILVGIVGGLLMGWAGWQEFQAEGGKFQIGKKIRISGAAWRPAGHAPMFRWLSCSSAVTLTSTKRQVMAAM